MNNTILKTFYILLLSSLFFACKTVKKEGIQGFENEYFGIEGVSCTEKLNPNAMDSRVGTLDCGCVTFNYDFGKYSYEGPLTAKEEFRKSFDAYHHTKFFEKLMIDPKVNKIFLDSVKVIDVRRKLVSDSLVIECETCNTTAELTFKGYTFLYPVTLSEKQLDKKIEDISFRDESTYRHKSFKDNNGEPALYITPIQNRFKKKDCLSMTVAKSECSQETVRKILDSIYIKEQPKK